MRRIGIHMSFPSVNETISGMKNWKLNTLQIATRNMRNMRQRSTIEYDLQQLASALARENFLPLVIHAPYSMNPASPDEETRQRCHKIIQADMDMMPNCDVRYVLHPGSYMWGDPMDGMKRLCDVLSSITIPRNVKICVETMAGQGTQLMDRDEHLQYILNCGIQNVYMTYDTCHVFAAGQFCTNVFDAYKDIIKVVHLNGSKAAFNSHVDRHDKAAGNGLLEVVVKRVPGDIPIILETPTDTMYEDVQWLQKID